MKFFIIAFALVGFVAAADTDAEATLLEGSETFAEYLTGTGYDYKFKTSNSIVREETADLEKNIVTGSYEYISPEGRLIKVTYTAGAGIGFKPYSTPDVIPSAIIDSIELNLKNPPEVPVE